MQDGVSFETIKLFVLYLGVIFVWMISTKKLYTRDYVTFLVAGFITPFVFQLMYTNVPMHWHNTSNDLLIMLMLYFVLHIIGNSIRRGIRDLQKHPRHIL